MNLDRYIYSTNDAHLDYEFESTGPKGIIKKVVRLIPVGDGVFNLGFGDLDEETGEIDDFVTSNNNDTEKVLATVAAIANNFAVVYPNAIIFIEGTTKAKTRLYQMNISKYWGEISKLFEVRGLKNNKWEPFQKIANYEAFLARSL